MILAKVPAAKDESNEPLVAQPFNLAYDNFLGRLAVARIWKGKIKTNQNVFVKKADGTVEQGRVVKLFTFAGMGKVDATEAISGDVAMIAGLTNIYIGDTVTDSMDTPSLY